MRPRAWIIRPERLICSTCALTATRAHRPVQQADGQLPPRQCSPLGSRRVKTLNKMMGHRMASQFLFGSSQARISPPSPSSRRFRVARPQQSQQRPLLQQLSFHRASPPQLPTQLAEQQKQRRAAFTPWWTNRMSIEWSMHLRQHHRSLALLASNQSPWHTTLTLVTIALHLMHEASHTLGHGTCTWDRR